MQKMVSDITNAGSFAFDTETTSTNPMSADLVGLSFSISQGQGWYIPVGHINEDQLALEEVLTAVRPLLESDDLAKSAHNANFDMLMLRNYGIIPNNVEHDTMVSAHLLRKTGIGLKNLALEVLGEDMTTISSLIGTGKKQIQMDQVPVTQVLEYAAEDADVPWRLVNTLSETLAAEELSDLFHKVEMPLVSILAIIDRKSVVLGKSVDLGGRRTIKKKIRTSTTYQLHLSRH